MLYKNTELIFYTWPLLSSSLIYWGIGIGGVLIIVTMYLSETTLGLGVVTIYYLGVVSMKY